MTNPWLTGPNPAQALQRVLEERIRNHAERGKSLHQQSMDPLIIVTADRIVYTEHWLRRDGYPPRQLGAAR